MEYKTILRSVRSAPRKTRYVVDMLRNKSVPEAQRILKYTPKRSSYFLLKMVNSAVANATNIDVNITPDNLYISEIKVCDGPAFKRWRSASMGRASQVKKRTSHITLVLKTIAQPAKPSGQARPEAAAKRPKAPAENEKESKTK